MFSNSERLASGSYFFRIVSGDSITKGQLTILK